MSTKKNIVLGIDLGTTNSCMAYTDGGETKIIPNRSGANTTPSVIAFDKAFQKVIGVSAKRMPPSENIFYETKRLIGRKFTETKEMQKNVSYKIVAADNGDAWVECGGKKYSPSQMGSYILQALKEDAENYLGVKITQAVITVPAYFNDAQRQATKDAGKIAGLEVLRIINEPTAAALAYGLDKDAKSKKIAVYDLGGGTFDISILEIEDGVFEVLATNGDTMLGGGDFDQQIVNFLLKEYENANGRELGVALAQDKIALQRLKDAAEKAKIELSNAVETDISLPYLGADSNGPKHLNVKINRAKFEEMCIPLIKKSLDPCAKALKDAGINASVLDDVVMVGGMTRMPKVLEMVKDFFKKELHRGVNPDEVVAYGAAIQGGILRGDVKNVVLLDVTPLTLGIETEGGVLAPIVERNTTIPSKKSQIFSTASDNQTQVHIRVFQGERPVAADNKILGDFVLDGIPSARRGMPQIEVTFDIDADGILHVSAKDKGTNKEQSITIQSSGGLSKEEIERMIQEAEANSEKDKQKAELIKLKNQADSLIHTVEQGLEEHGDKLSDEEKKNTQDALTRTKEVKDTEDLELLKKAIDDLSKNSMKIGEIVYKEAQKKENNQSDSNSSSENEKDDDNVVDVQ